MDPSRAVLQAFQQFDGSKGWLTRHEFKCAYIAVFGAKPSSMQLNGVYSRPASKDNGAGFDTFHTVCKEALSNQDSAEHVRQVFKAFDVRSSGFISREDTYRVFQNAAPTVHQRVIDEIFDELDMDHDGRVNCRDFCTMLMIRNIS